MFLKDGFVENGVNISSKEQFNDDMEFSKESLQNPKKGGRPQNSVYFGFQKPSLQI